MASQATYDINRWHGTLSVEASTLGLPPDAYPDTIKVPGVGVFQRVTLDGAGATYKRIGTLGTILDSITLAILND